jgi:phosphoribosylformylglycinamidine cyclo-ligase
MSLTYRASGVDIEAAAKAKERIRKLVLRTHGDSVVSRPGHFGGAVRLEPGQDSSLVGALGSTPDHPPDAEDGGPASVVQSCLAGLPPGSRPVAFLDYVASAGLEPGAVERLVEGFADRLASPPRIPLIGGETAEMPGVLRPGASEVVGAVFGVPKRPGPDSSAPGEAGASGRPCLVFSMDGVGTKTKLAVLAGSTGGLALDIIHHSLNDILCLGASGKALLFYVGCHRKDEAVLEPFQRAAAEACARLGLSALEVRVAEKPATYLPGEIDICAAVAGAVDEGCLLQGDAVRAGDALIGLASDGLHTNGYSLARRALLERAGLKLDARVSELGCTLAEALLAPHRNYAPAVLPLLAGRPSPVHAVAHITGGGLADNLARVLPAGLRGVVRLGSWEVPPLFRLIQRCGQVPERDPAGKGMYETFNMGLGLVLAVEAGSTEEVLRRLKAAGERAVVLGEVRRSEGRRRGRGEVRQGGRPGKRAGGRPGETGAGVELVP